MRELEYTVLYTICEGIGIYRIVYYIGANWNTPYCILYMRELEYTVCILYMRELVYTVLYTIYEGIGIYCIVYHI